MRLIALRKSVTASVLFLVIVLSTEAVSFDNELHHRILNTTAASEPYITGNTILMSYSAPQGTQAVSLALEHENYRTFHTYEKNRHGIFIFAMKIPENQDRIRYRLVVDGLWTIDPRAGSERDSRGVLVSRINLPKNSSAPVPGVTALPDGRTRFVFSGNPGSRVFVAGDFNRWDPYLTPMNESPVYEGVFTATVQLPAGSRFYRYVVDGKEILDPDNPLTSRNGWGESASVIR